MQSFGSLARAALRTATGLSFVVIATAADAKPVTVCDLGIAAFAPFYIGIDKGYFAAQKIDLVLQPFSSGADALVPLATDQLQVVAGGVGAGFFNAFTRDWPVRIAMGSTRDVPGYSSDTLVMREDLKSGLNSIKDLKGKKIALNAPGSVLGFLVGKTLASAGLSMSDIDLTYMSWPNMGIAFGTKAIDGGTVAEPFVTQFNEQHLAFPFRRASQVIANPALETSMMLYSKGWIDRDPDQVQAFTIAYLQAVRDYYDAMKGGPKRAEVVDTLVKYTKVKDKPLYDKMEWSYMDPNAQISVVGLKDQQDWYLSQGTVTQKADIASFIDTRFLDKALEKLGRIDVTK